MKLRYIADSMDKKKLVDHIDEIENLRDIIKHNLNGLQIHLDKIKKILNEPDIDPELKPQPQPSSIPLEKLKDRYLTPKETSELTGINPATLANQRSARRGIPFIKVGRSIRYRMNDILAFMDEHRIDPEELRSRGRGHLR
jgi:hypothetical protein